MNKLQDTLKQRQQGGSKKDHDQVNCPKCFKPMERSAYNGSRIIIDVCLQCNQRWLDAGELHEIATLKPHYTLKHLRLISDLDSELDALSQFEEVEINPRVSSSGLVGGRVSLTRAPFFVIKLFVDYLTGLRSSNYKLLLKYYWPSLVLVLFLFITTFAVAVYMGQRFNEAVQLLQSTAY